MINGKTASIFFIVFICVIIFISMILIGERGNMDAIGREYAGKPDLDRAIEYRKVNIKIWAINFLLTFLIPTIFLITGLSAKIRDFVQAKSINSFTAICLYAFFYLLIDFLIALPLNYYSGFVIRHRFGLSNQNIHRWLSNVLKNTLISVLVWMLFLWLPYYLIKKYPDRWWLYLGLISIPVYTFVTLITPMYIDPLFNKYMPIREGALKVRIESQLEKAGIEGCDVYEVDKSRDTKEMNAYMTGVFGSKRIVIWDTTIDNLTEDETISIVSHEIGHYVKGHIWKSIVLGGLLTIMVLYFTNILSFWIMGMSDGAFGFTKLYDIASLPLFILVLNIIVFIASPAMNGYSRYIERQADRFEIELAGNKEAYLSSLDKLYNKSLSLPRPSKIYKIFYCTHPPYEERVEMAKAYETGNQHSTPYKEEKVQRQEIINSYGMLLKDRINPPVGFERDKEDKDSFSYYLRHLPLKPHGSDVYYYDGRVKGRKVYEAVVDMDIGERDLQQCADAVMRLRAEYLYGIGDYGRIHFNFTNGFRADYTKWMEGYRIKVDGNNTSWVKKTGYNDDYQSFRGYLNMVFAYAGTYSLQRELQSVDIDDMQVGDVFIQGGSPGHCVIVVDMAKEAKTGQRVFMVAQSYMPAQDIHILKNLQDDCISPWYRLDEIEDRLITPEWTFDRGALMRFPD
ncbi:MAG: M48 family metalloprotease [Xylanivirga thermophila]|uniref:DUF4846 domain-containing protein n=1 Tax=Xylanivirga thermophila TaxID=2496273 RepID=UPI0039F5C605